MKEEEILKKIMQAVQSSKSSLATVEKWGQLLAEKQGITLDPLQSKLTGFEKDSYENEETEEKIIEGVFDGQNMLGADKNTYPVPANYASKSKLVEGDGLKLTIQPNGAFIYKQIEQVQRKLITGYLILDGSQYRVLGEDQKTYAVLYASVTFFRAKVGDEVTIIIPAEEEASWAAIENVLPKSSSVSK